MGTEQELEKVVEQIKHVDNGLNSVIVPMLKDTIDDYKKTFNKMVVIIIMLIIALIGTFVYSQYLISEEAEKYNEFLSQFEFESEEIYQEINNDNYGNATINEGITVGEN